MSTHKFKVLATAAALRLKRVIHDLVNIYVAPPVSEIFGQNAQNSGNKETIKDGIKKIHNCFKFFKWKLVSSTQQLILLTLFIIRPVSSNQTDFIRDSNKMSKGNYNCSFIHEVIVQKHVPVRV